MIKKINKLLVANRGEIAIRIFRAANELSINTVAIFAQEDAHSVHRFKADESYLVGKGKKPIEAYLDIESIIAIAKDAQVDAIHPGYGFLSENQQFAKRCLEENIIFIGPHIDQLDTFGDKVKAKQAAMTFGLPTIPSTPGPVSSLDEVYAFADKYGYPIMLKAAMGGGGKGMRIVRSAHEVNMHYVNASNEAKTSFGNPDLYVEKYIENPKHIEVQVLGDSHGNAVHLFERDCSVQRRHQKVVEIAPSIDMSNDIRAYICEQAAEFLKNVGYVNAGTVEFLWTGGKDFYFIEVNPRIQVEHTITELVTGFDIVHAQIKIAQGQSVFEALNITEQSHIQLIGSAIQCRITTEDPKNNFIPDVGKINTYRSPGGYGIRLDAGNGFQGNQVTPYFDSLLVKCCTYARTFEEALIKMKRALAEFRIRGVKTNIPFLMNVIEHDAFSSGLATTTFIDQTPELFVYNRLSNRGNKLLRYIGDVTINGYKGIAKQEKPEAFELVQVKDLQKRPTIIRPKQLLNDSGPQAVVDWIQSQNNVLVTDTTFRDAHQSLLATRMRTKDLKDMASLYDAFLPELFSVEMWGGATFDTAYRFLLESPWDRLAHLRQQMPNTLLQMLIRGSNAVGYQNYPDSVIDEFIQLSAKNGIDVFRIFDALNWMPQLEKSIQSVRDAGKLAEVAMCYTGNILDAHATKYTLDYYMHLAKAIESSGAHILAIKDMAGLLKPQAAYQLISKLKETVNLPIHLHTHDTSGIGIYTYAAAVRAGVDIVDVAMPSFAGATSQPNLAALWHGLDHSEKELSLDAKNVDIINRNWSMVRRQYQAFETQTVQSSNVYDHQMPGGQFTNLQQQAKSVGIPEDRFDDVVNMYRTVNTLFGDIIKVTPTSKVVGDMALFMIQNDLTADNILEKGKLISFPESVVAFFRGDLGQPTGGFPEALQQVVLKDVKPFSIRPGLMATPVDFNDIAEQLGTTYASEPSREDIISHVLYPKVYSDYRNVTHHFGDVSVLDTPTFFYGMVPGEEINVSIEKGKTLTIKLIQIGEVDENGNRVMYFNFNGQNRELVIRDQSFKQVALSHPKVDETNPYHVGASMPGTIVKVFVEPGQRVQIGDPLILTESMKMETTIQSTHAGIVDKVHVGVNDLVESKDLLIELK